MIDQESYDLLVQLFMDKILHYLDSPFYLHTQPLQLLEGEISNKKAVRGCRGKEYSWLSLIRIRFLFELQRESISR